MCELNVCNDWLTMTQLILLIIEVALGHHGYNMYALSPSHQTIGVINNLLTVV